MKDLEKIKILKKNAPCYVYDKTQIVARCRELKRVMPPEIKLLYSVKANPFVPVVKTIISEGFGADAASAGEVLLVADVCGLSHDRIFFSAPGKSEEDISEAWKKCVFIADSFSELKKLDSFAAKGGIRLAVGIRVNPTFSMDDNSAVSSKFGIDEELLIQNTMRFSHLEIAGIHTHLQSQILNVQKLSMYYQNCYALAERLQGVSGIGLRFINFGSGLGTVYDPEKDHAPELSILGQTMQELVLQNKKRLQAELYLETGRFLTCNAGTYYTCVVDRKESRGKTYLIVQNAMNGFLRPTVAELLRQNAGEFPQRGQEPLYTSGSACRISVVGRQGNTETVDVVGNLCTALDVMARGIRLPRAEIGDILAVSNAGSYGYSLSLQLFSTQKKPGQYLWEERDACSDVPIKNQEDIK